MKATEFRVGNWIMGDIGKPYQMELSDFSDWYMDHNSHEFGNHIHPIPLTEEWLLKFGFDYDNETSTYSLLTSLRKCDLCIDILLSDGEYFWKYVELKYVHQLQNLYFALTGNELEIK